MSAFLLVSEIQTVLCEEMHEFWDRLKGMANNW